MNEPVNVKEVLVRLHDCLEELSDATGVQRCALIHAMAILIEALQRGVAADEEMYKKKIKDLEHLLDEENN